MTKKEWKWKKKCSKRKILKIKAAKNCKKYIRKEYKKNE